MAIQFDRFQRSPSAMNITVSSGSSTGAMCRMYSSTTRWSSSTIITLRWSEDPLVVQSECAASISRPPGCALREHDVHDCVTDRGVAVLQPDGEHAAQSRAVLVPPVGLGLQEVAEDHVEQPRFVMQRLSASVGEGRPEHGRVPT